MREFRFSGITVQGNSYQGTITANNQNEAKRKVEALAKQHGLRIQSIDKRVAFMYKARRRGQKNVVKGEIFAFTADEVRDSLGRMGYEVLKVERNYLHFKMAVPEKDVVVFMRLCADLLREKYPYDEILTMLAQDMENKTLRETIMEIHKDLKAGHDGRQVYGKHSRALGRFTTYMLSLASSSGNMAEIFDNAAKYLERSNEFKKNLRSILFMPTIVLITSIGALIFYVTYIFPEIAGMFTKFNIDVPPMTAATLSFSDFLKANIYWLTFVTLAPIAGLIYYFNTDQGRFFKDKYILRLPIVGRLIYRSSIEVFSRVFYILYSGSGENIEAIKIAAEACRNGYLEKQIKEVVIPTMLREGRSFAEVLEATRIFPRNAIYNLRSGEESGTLREAALRLANFYEKETKHKMGQVVEVINLAITIIVSIMIIGITLLSTEIGFISTPPPVGR